MAYQVGNRISGSDYNTMIGAQGTSAYADQTAVDAAAPSVGSLWGVGYGDRGHGQSSFPLSAVSAGDVITAAQWLSLRNALADLRASQTGSVPSLIPPTALFDAGDLIEAHEASAPTSDPYDFNSEIALADTNRLTVDVVNLVSGVVSGTNTATRSGTWGGAGGGIELVFDVSWPSTDEARYFFNSGGQIRISLSHPTGSAQDTNWNTALSTRVGQIRIGAHSTAMQGTMGSTAALGYYEATSSIQTIFSDVVVGTSPYAANLFRLRYQSLGSAANGGPGSGLRLTIRLIDAHTNSFSDTVASGTAAAFTHAKNGYLSSPSIVTPTGAVNSAWTVV